MCVTCDADWQLNYTLQSKVPCDDVIPDKKYRITKY